MIASLFDLATVGAGVFAITHPPLSPRPVTPWEVVLLGGVLLCVGIAAVTDLRTGRIPNALTYPAMIAAVLLHGLRGGSEGLLFAISGWFACGFIMLICFVLFGIGGGDVKLLAMIGAFLGVHHGIEALLWTCVLGAAVAIGMLIWRVGLLRIITGIGRYLLQVVRARSRLPLTDEEKQPLQTTLYLAAPSFVATLIVIFGMFN